MLDLGVATASAEHVAQTAKLLLGLASDIAGARLSALTGLPTKQPINLRGNRARELVFQEAQNSVNCLARLIGGKSSPL
jgi:hypothetical protein